MTNIKLIDKNTDVSKLQKHKLKWDLEINGKKYDVWRFAGYYHTIGGTFGENDYWCCPEGREPTYESLLEYDAHHAGVTWGIQIEQTNHIKHKWGETRVDNTGKWIITRNGKPFFEGFSRCIDNAWIRARNTLYQIRECPLNFCDKDWKENAIGKEIYYHGEPAIIERIIEDQGSMLVVPDKKYIDKFSPFVFEIEDYINGDDHAPIEEYLNGLFVGYTSPHIWWYRDIKKVQEKKQCPITK